MEIEYRFKAPKNIKNILQDIGAIRKSEQTQDDEYFKFNLDTERKLVIRLRKKSNGKEVLTFKGSSEDTEDTAWQEWESNIQNSDILKKLLLSNGLVNVVRIQKQRESYQFEQFEINIDQIKDLGTFVEVELQSTDVKTAKEKILAFIENIGIKKEHVVTKGYVPLMLESKSH